MVCINGWMDGWMEGGSLSVVFRWLGDIGTLELGREEGRCLLLRKRAVVLIAHVLGIVGLVVLR